MRMREVEGGYVELDTSVDSELMTEANDMAAAIFELLDCGSITMITGAGSSLKDMETALRQRAAKAIACRTIYEVVRPPDGGPGPSIKEAIDGAALQLVEVQYKAERKSRRRGHLKPV